MLVIGTLAGFSVSMVTAAPLYADGGSIWWYPQDSARAVTASANDQQQTTVPIRSGQQQGFVITLYNDSDWTQTVLGTGAGFGTPGSPFGSVGVAAPDMEGASPFPPRGRYTLPGVIPPHQARAVRVLWTSVVCLQKDTAQWITQLSLRVRTGWFTRTEIIQLDEGWTVSGPSQGHCH